MPIKTGNDLFVVDNSDEDWKVLNYLAEWREISSLAQFSPITENSQNPSTGSGRTESPARSLFDLDDDLDGLAAAAGAVELESEPAPAPKA